MTKSKYLLSGLAAAALFPGVVCAQSTFDNSGNSLLKGTYFIRQVWYGNISATGTIGEAASLTGTISFDGNGNYTLNAQVSDNTVSSGTPQLLSNVAGSYAVNASGVFMMVDPLSTSDFIYGGVGASAITGSATENTNSFLDFMVAVPMGSSVTNASLNGTYRVVAMEYPNGDVTMVTNSSFLINPDGAGNLGAINLSGHAVNVSDTLFNQTISGATYSLSSSTGTLTFPAQASGTSLISGTKQFFVSADGNILVAGSLDGYDIEIGINIGGAAASTSLSGTYFSSGEDYESTSFAMNGVYYIDAFFGSTHASTSGGNTSFVADQRVNSDYYYQYDYTFSDQFSLAADGSATETNYLDYVGAGGAAKVLIGQSQFYSIELDVQAVPLTPTGSVILNPLGVANGANFLPITNPIAPGEFITLFGTGIGPASVVQAALPYPDTLGGVSVSINGTPAPVQLASSGQVNCIVPYELNDPFAVVQVTYNGVTSNAVTLYVDTSAPGIFTLDESGLGDAAALHKDGTVVNAANPAQVGETIAVYVTGLGTVSPASADGAAASSSPLSYTDDTIVAYVDDVGPIAPTYEGLAPGFAGLYQVNVTIPSTPDTGAVFLDINDTTNGAYDSVAVVEVSGTAASAKPKALQAGSGKRARSRHGRIRSKTNAPLNRRLPAFNQALLQR